MIIRQLAYARSGLVGNPSDIFGGKTISFLFDAFKAEIVLYETPSLHIVPTQRDITRFESIDNLVEYRTRYGYYGGIRIIEAIIVRFRNYCRDHGIELPDRNFTIEYDCDIPFGLGLGGSSTIIKAVLTGLMEFFELTDEQIPKPIQPHLVLEAETEELDISAGPQDRVVAVYGGLVYMDFSQEAYKANGGLHGDYRSLDPTSLPPLFIVYKDELAKSSGRVHNIMRYRATVEHDPRVTDVMSQKAALVDEALTCLVNHEPEKLGPIMSRDFDLRRSVYDLSPENIRMIEIARENQAHAKFTGSGGAAVGTYKDEAHLESLRQAYAAAGYRTLRVNVVEFGDNRS